MLHELETWIIALNLCKNAKLILFGTQEQGLCTAAPSPLSCSLHPERKWDTRKSFRRSGMWFKSYACSPTLAQREDES